MITLTHDYQTDYAALADILGADVVDAVLVMMGDTSCTWQRLALYAGNVGDSDTMEELAGLAVVLRTDEAVLVISALMELIRDMRADLEKAWRRVSEAETAEELESASELVRLSQELLDSAQGAYKAIRR